MPLGSLLLGWVTGEFGVRNAVLVPVFGMMIVIAALLARSKLWHIERHSPASAALAREAVDGA
jgi:hypothetical protein